MHGEEIHQWLLDIMVMHSEALNTGKDPTPGEDLCLYDSLVAVPG